MIFQKHIINGKATHFIECQKNAILVIFDILGIKILKVTLDEGIPAHFALEEEKPYLGRALVVPFASETKKVNITYTTSPKAEALQ